MKKRFGHHLAQLVLDTTLEMTEDDPGRLLLASDLGRYLYLTTGVNPGTPTIQSAVIELANKGYLYRYSRCHHVMFGRPRTDPTWPRRL